MKVAIVKYNAGNVQSVRFAIERLGLEPIVTDVAEELQSADKVIFPGVGEASTAMRFLREKQLHLLIPQLKQPVLGVCLGLQLMCKHSEENNTDCLGIFPLEVKKFKQAKKVPQMGWNTVEALKSTLFSSIEEESHFYFVHSYYAELSDNFTIARCTYGETFSASLQRDNFYAAQFHPEKSSSVGAQLIENFLKRC